MNGLCYMLHAIWTNWVQLLAVDILPFFLSLFPCCFLCLYTFLDGEVNFLNVYVNASMMVSLYMSWFMKCEYPLRIRV